MRPIAQLIDEGNWLSLLFVAGVLAYIGQSMVDHRPELKLWGVRISVITFLLFSVTRVVAYGEPMTSDLVAAVLQGAIAAALTVGPTWIGLACAHFLSVRVASFCDNVRRRLTRLLSVRPDRHDVRQAEDDARRRREQSNRQSADRHRAIDGLKRRNDARAKALRAFHVLRSGLGERFTDKEFSDYLKTYLADQQTPEDVEYHANKLIQLLKQIAQGAEGGPASYSALNQRFEQQRAEIQAAPVDDGLKDILLLELEEQYEEQVRHLIRKDRR